MRSGHVRAIIGKTYMLTQDEELWEKELPLKIEQFLQPECFTENSIRKKDVDAKTTTASSPPLPRKSIGRDKSKLVTYHVPHNEAVEVYDYKTKNSRIIFGPELVMLQPDENFTYINLSGSLPTSLILLAFLFLVFWWRKVITNKKHLVISILVLIFCYVLRRFMK